MENYIQIAYEKTIDRVRSVWYHIVKERETEKLEEPKGVTVKANALLQIADEWQDWNWFWNGFEGTYI